MHTNLLFLNLGGGEVFLVLVVILLLFGGKGVPTIARTLGKGIREFKDATNGIQRDLQNHANTVKQEVINNTQVVHEQAQQVNQTINHNQPQQREESQTSN